MYARHVRFRVNLDSGTLQAKHLQPAWGQYYAIKALDPKVLSVALANRKAACQWPCPQNGVYDQMGDRKARYINRPR